MALVLRSAREKRKAHASSCCRCWFPAAIFGVITVGLVRSHPAAGRQRAAGPYQRGTRSDPDPEGLAGGCSALTGIEAIAIGVPAFRALLGAMLIGLSVLIRREHVPPGSVTVLAQLTAGSFGTAGPTT